MVIIEVFMFIIVTIYLFFRYKKATKSDGLIGFLLNPMLYFVIFGLLYLLMGNIFVGLGAFSVLTTGLQSDVTDATNSNMYVDVYFMLVFAGYLLVKDVNGLRFNPIAYKKNNEIFFNLLNFIILLLVIFICVRYASELISLKGNRVAAYDYFANNIYIPYRLGVVVNIYSALIVILSFSRRLWSRIFVLLPFILFFLLDYMQGGRSLAIRLSMIVYIVLAIRNNRLYFIQIISAVLFIGFVPAVGRLSEGDGIYTVFIAFGEFIFTRLTVDYVIVHHMVGSVVVASLKFLTSILPGVIGSQLLGADGDYRDLIESVSGLTWGLAGNIVAEAIYYFGDLYFISVLMIILTSNIFYSRFSLNRMPFIIVLVIFISNIQDVYRTSFFEFGLVMFYLMFSYLSVFSILLWNKRAFVAVN